METQSVLVLILALVAIGYLARKYVPMGSKKKDGCGNGDCGC